jgi:hypothetical protein
MTRQQAKGTGRGFSRRRRPARPVSRGTGILASSGQMGAHDEVEEEDGQVLPLAAQRSGELCSRKEKGPSSLVTEGWPTASPRLPNLSS